MAGYTGLESSVVLVAFVDFLAARLRAIAALGIGGVLSKLRMTSVKVERSTIMARLASLRAG